MEANLKINHKKYKSSLSYLINSILFFIYTFFSILTPADSLNIKIISVILLLIYNFVLILRMSLKKEFYVIGFHVFIFSSVLFIFSILSGGSLYDTISNIYVCFLASFIIVIIYRKINFEKYMLLSLIIVSSIMVVSVLLDTLNIIDIYNNNLMMYLHNNSEAMIGKSPLYWSYYVIFLKASPLILILLGYSLYHKKYVLSVLSTLALLISGTRANFFSTIFLITVYIFCIQKKALYKLITILVASAIAILYFENINNYFSYMFISKSYSKIDKINDLKEMFTVFKKYPLTFFIGTGFGSELKYSITNGTAELSLFDMWRKNGFTGLIMFLYFVLKPIHILWKKREARWMVFTYISYIMVAMTNPLFFSSTAYIIYMYIYVMYYNVKSEFNYEKTIHHHST